jgi:hypothetical protein
MIVDFQHHYTPPELMERGTDIGALRLDENGNPNYRFNPLLADLPAHVRMMDRQASTLRCYPAARASANPTLPPAG